MKRIYAIWLLILLLIIPAFAGDLKTAAEKADFKAITSNEELVNYLIDLQQTTDNMKIKFFGSSASGQQMPMVILAKPPVYSPWEAYFQGKVIFLIDAQVHGNEPAGCEASLILMRKIAGGDLSYLLDKMVIIIVPRLNPDGAEAFRRHNSLNYDMNRDYMKIDSPEIKAFLSEVLNKYHPHVVIDAHEAGSRAYDFLLESCLHPNAPGNLSRIGEKEFLAAIKTALEEKGYKPFWYFKFVSKNKPEEGIKRGSFQSTTNRNYSGLQNSISFLFESTTFPGRSDLGKRVNCHLIAMTAALKYAYEHNEEVLKAVNEARIQAYAGKAGDKIALREKRVASPEPVEYLIYEIREVKDPQTGRIKLERTEKVVKVKGTAFDLLVPTLVTERPYGYILPPYMRKIAEILKIHGISVERLARPANLSVESFIVEEAKTKKKVEEGHFKVCIKVRKQKETRLFEDGSFYISLAQPSANLAISLLEPEAENSLLSVNYFDSFLEKGARLPVYRIVEKPNISTVLE
ncbi:MAG: succinylglutamate desuccinylase/aspartoacylase family protein [Firmicutes bacterium]|nr:succinylglutamate desuccinylase/aspartoacylase family protein [Bacillota bacterium]